MGSLYEEFTIVLKGRIKIYSCVSATSSSVTLLCDDLLKHRRLN